MSFTEILYEEDGPIGTITLNRPDNGNMFTQVMCHEIRDCIQAASTAALVQHTTATTTARASVSDRNGGVRAMTDLSRRVPC